MLGTHGFDVTLSELIDQIRLVSGSYTYLVGVKASLAETCLTQLHTSRVLTVRQAALIMSTLIIDREAPANANGFFVTKAIFEHSQDQPDDVLVSQLSHLLFCLLTFPSGRVNQLIGMERTLSTFSR